MSKLVDLRKQFSKDIECLFSYDYREGISNHPDMDLYIDDMGCLVESIYIGSVFQIMPSGKYYMPWTTNQTWRDVVMDAHFMEMLEARCEYFGLCVTFGEGCSTDMFVSNWRGEDFVSTEDYKTFYQHGNLVASSAKELEDYFVDAGVYEDVVSISDHGNIEYYNYNQSTGR